MKVRYERDSIDLEELKDCVSRRGYQLISEKYVSMLEAYRLKLETASTAEVGFIQGQIACVRACMALPQILHDEIRAKQRRKDIAE